MQWLVRSLCAETQRNSDAEKQHSATSPFTPRPEGRVFLEQSTINITITITNPSVNVLAALAGAHAADNAKMMESLDKPSTTPTFLSTRS